MSTPLSIQYDAAFGLIIHLEVELSRLLAATPAVDGIDTPERARIRRAIDSVIDAQEALTLNTEELPT